MEGIFGYIDTFRERVEKEPRWIPGSVTNSLLELLTLEDIGIFRISKQIQSSINSYIYRLAKNYNEELTKMTMPGTDSYVFGIARLFPIHSLEWCLAVLEFCVQHSPEISWIYRIIRSKTYRIMRNSYGESISEEFIRVVDDAKYNKHFEWNRNMYSIIDDLLERTEKSSLKYMSKISKQELTDMLFSVSRSTWGAKDNIDIEDSFVVPSKLSYPTQVSMVLLNMIGNINTKVRRKTEEDN